MCTVQLVVRDLGRTLEPITWNKGKRKKRWKDECRKLCGDA